MEWLRARNDGVRLEQLGATESVLALANSVNASLVNTDVVVRVAHAARRAAKLGYVCGYEYITKIVWFKSSGSSFDRRIRIRLGI